MADFGDLWINETVTIPAWELSEAFVRASGPGGQNVNKVSTAVQLTWMVEHSSVPEAVKARFLRMYASRITKDGRLILEASEHRSQGLNREAARARLKDMVLRAATPPKRRIKTRPTRGSVRRRLTAKKQRAEVKTRRGKVDPSEN